MPRILLAIAFTVCALPPATAQSRADDPRNRLPEAVNRIERETGGRVLSAERRTRGGREVSRIKVYTPEGRVRIMWDDPQRDRPERAERPDVGERGGRGRAVPSRGAQSEVPSLMVQRALRPEQTPLPEQSGRRDDGSPQR
ncbi:PepSY domain-containing protein [Chiayiivirga flava]|uniref:PepSY domain-containing protein n=1 Tax=Chiayiivirga flava TaxID=659595 RepID=A0A7W8G0P5_9GAMM|nr:hypothetical protein [Chiayiivirga flava]MBB5209692.1 hypothetical protein [Chiayiivirga flava]